MSAHASEPLKSRETNPVRVCIVDDSIVVRGMLSRWVSDQDGMVVAGTCRNGREAVEHAAGMRPDIIILDIDMPEMDGLTALPLLLQRCPGARIIVASTLSQRNAKISLRAMSLGAADYLPKPDSKFGIATSGAFRRELLEKIRMLSPGNGTSPEAPQPDDARPPATRFTFREPSTEPPRILLIGASTGGPQALGQLLSGLSQSVFDRLPIVIVQHMPASFTPVLAAHLGQICGRPAFEVRHREFLEPGFLLIAPGGKHTRIEAASYAPRGVLSDDAPVHFCRPAVDPLFESAAAVYGASALAVVLTGMGKDGSAGAGNIASAGGTVLVQDEESSIVWGMPRAVAATGAACGALPPDGLARRVNQLVEAGLS